MFKRQLSPSYFHSKWSPWLVGWLVWCTLLFPWCVVTGRQASILTNTKSSSSSSDNDRSGSSSSSSSSSNKQPEFRIAGYLPDYRVGMLQETNYSMVRYLDDLYLFSVAPRKIERRSGSSSSSFSAKDDPFQSVTCCLHHDQYEEVRIARQRSRSSSSSTNRNDRLKVWLTIGGAGRSDGMVITKLYEQQQQLFIEGLLSLIEREQLDGIDLDCEYVFQSRDDYMTYLHLVTQITDAVQHMNDAKKHNCEKNSNDEDDTIRYIQVSIALHSHQALPQVVYDKIDRVNLMTYDLSSDMYHADMRKVHEAVSILIQSGCPSHKIFLGIPSYGRRQLKQSYHDVITYREVIDSVWNNNTQNNNSINTATATNNNNNNNDDSSTISSPISLDHLSRLSKYNGYQFESQRSVVKKVQYAYRTKLGGVFFWEIGQDKYATSTSSNPNDNIITSSSNQQQQQQQQWILPEKYNGGMLLYSAHKTRTKLFQTSIDNTTASATTTTTEATITSMKQKTSAQEEEL